MTLIRVAAQGDLERFMSDELKKSEKAVTEGVKVTADRLKEALRSQVRGAGLGEGLARAWRSERYPRTGVSLRAAASVFSKAPHIHQAFDRSETIRSKDGFWIAIPTENAPKRIGRKRVSPSNFPEHRFGPLRFVFLKGRPRLALLVVDNVRRSRGKRGGFRRASDAARRRGDFENSVPMFWLVPDVKLRRRTNVEAAAKRYERLFPDFIDEAFRRLDGQDAFR